MGWLHGKKAGCVPPPLQHPGDPDVQNGGSGDGHIFCAWKKYPNQAETIRKLCDIGVEHRGWGAERETIASGIVVMLLHC